MNGEDIKSRLEGNGVLPIGMRGTSYEMVVYLFEIGVLTGNKKEAKRRGGTYIYFWPIRENWDANGLTPPVPWGENYWKPWENSEGFARIHVEHDFFRRLTGFSIGEYEGRVSYGLEDTPKKVREAMSESGLTDSDIADLINETNRRKGYILEFHPDMVRDHRIEPDAWFGDNHSVAFQVDCPHGLSQKYISKITPISEWDRELMNRYMRERGVLMSRAP